MEVLNNFDGDKSIQLDPDTDEGKQKIAELFHSLLLQGTAVFFERGNETYKVKGYDPKEYKLRIEVPAKRGRKRKVVAVHPQQQRDRVTAVAPRSGG
jgi:hypothetical protein